jgi:protein SCO1/2
MRANLTQSIGKMVMLLGLVLFNLGCQASAATYEYKGAIIDPPQSLPDFQLMNSTGQPFRMSQTEDKLSLIYFGYTYCPDVCPLTLWEVKKALADLEIDQEQVQVIFITVDPERDTPERLSQYVQAFGPQFIGLTDDDQKIREVMAFFGAFAAREEVPNSAVGYLVNHSASLYLIDAQRRLRLQYPFGFEADDLRSDLLHLLQQDELEEIER